MQKQLIVMFGNHFDLVWRRPWARDYTYLGKRYLGYRRLQNLLIDRNLTMAEEGRGSYKVEQALSVRAYLEEHPEALPRLQALHRQGLFEVLGAGESIMDVNMCFSETMVRNLASGIDYCDRILGMPPNLACHNDGFGSSAQFPQVMRGCGLAGIRGMSYCCPELPYWRGLDGSTVAVLKDPPGVTLFYDHCYHEPCRACDGQGCDSCEATGLDLPQNVYPPFEPPPDSAFNDGMAMYKICSEEMLPPSCMTELMATWEAAGISCQWGTNRAFDDLFRHQLDAVDHAPADQISARVENNPVQTGCYVSRSRIKQLARRCEALFYSWERALALTAPAALDDDRWTAFFLELPLYYFHDAITGTHQDEAYVELIDRMQEMLAGVDAFGRSALSSDQPEKPLWCFNPSHRRLPLRVTLPDEEWRSARPRVALLPDGRRAPVVLPLHPDAPKMPLLPSRLIAAVGPNARTRPDRIEPVIEVPELSPLEWSRIELVEGKPPQPLEGDVMENRWLRVELGDHGVKALEHLASGVRLEPELPLGHLLCEEDEGDPWGTRKICTFSKELARYTHRLGGLRCDGYSEVYFVGRYEPNLPFGREEDPAIFALEWYLTVRLLDDAERLDFQVELFWKSANRRIRACFPVGAQTDSAWYSIPGGWLERPRYEQTERCLWSPGGDWPAVHAVATQPDGTGLGWAIVNHGTPSARVADGSIDITLLRSPGFGHCLERYAQSYPMPTSGIRDGGWHLFTFSLLPHHGQTDLSRLMGTAAALNLAPPLVHAAAQPRATRLELQAEDAELLAIKRPFDGGDGLILRLANISPKPSTFTLNDVWQVAETDMRERPATAAAPAGTLTPWQIRTMRLTAPQA